MNLSVITQYQLRNVRLSLMIFSGIMLALVMLSAVLARIVPDTVSFSSMEASAGIFAFVCALNSFKENFGFALQNGVTRKTLFRSTLIMALCFSALLCALDQLLHLFTLLASQGAGNMRWFRLTEALYDLRYASATQLQTIAESIVFTFALYTALFMMGYMITLAYYRMSRWLKLTVSIGVPALLVLVYPLVDQLLLQGRISRALGQAISLALGIQAQNIWIAVLSLTLLAVAMAALAWALLRRAVIRS